ncbi:TPA: hypothetical protein DD449_02750 [Candidatus Berkelbacteria bacterium]|uniref:Uncharacterized protein n=1 Tax=Berkelbacteria bacterium GW2011_GWE1_39_12 TaxID=1618337 RepID=A0A0G4B3N6_9BACT|nr:MAG: hypothetical protein UT28_C0001G0222 [Berkelbacteria bacterium GW2011_GWE1_39_12]HBO60576.1 hypothetical protein [Candidatus Berkelbacteria bacterium]
MSLNENDLKQFEKIVKTTVQDSEQRLESRLELKIDQKVDEAKGEIISVLSREINDSAEINRAVISHIDSHEVRITRLEKKLV